MTHDHRHARRHLTPSRPGRGRARPVRAPSRGRLRCLRGDAARIRRGAAALARATAGDPARSQGRAPARIAATTSPRLERPQPRPLVWAVATLAAMIAGAAFTGTFRGLALRGSPGPDGARGRGPPRRAFSRTSRAARADRGVPAAVDLLRDPTTRVVTLHGLGRAGATGRVSGTRSWRPRVRRQPAGRTSGERVRAVDHRRWGAPAAGLFRVDASGGARTHRRRCKAASR